jgi:hypothetical protein
MIKKIIYFSALHAFIVVAVGLSSCMSTKTVQTTVPEDDVYYSNAKAKEIVIAEPVVREEKQSSDYVTEEELYGDTYGYYGYTDYTSRINRFRGYHPSLTYYNSIYGYNYDPFFSPSFFPYSYFGSPAINIGIGLNSGFYGYNPWRYYGYNYGSSFMGPYSFYNPYNYYGLELVITMGEITIVVIIVVFTAVQHLQVRTTGHVQAVQETIFQWKEVL